MLSAPGNVADPPQGSGASNDTGTHAFWSCMQSTDKPDTQVPWGRAWGQARHFYLCRDMPVGCHSGKSTTRPAQQETHLPTIELSPATTSCTVARISPCGLLEAMHV